MEYHEISLKMPTDYSDSQLREGILKEMKRGNPELVKLSELQELSELPALSELSRLSELSGANRKKIEFKILHKSLDARKKSDIHWLIRVGVLADNPYQQSICCTPHLKPLLDIPYRKREQKILVVGSGPAGFFAAYVLQKAGFNTTIIERGSDVKKREASIKEFESTGRFNPVTNYAFGEGGAGTFSDGKLTSRSKHISKEKDFVLSSYVKAGAPQEILYMAHPHLGSDNLKQIVKNLRKSFINIGGLILFETMLKDLKIKNGKVIGAQVSSAKSNCSNSTHSDDSYESSVCQIEGYNEIEADEVIIASGHSAYETYRMLISKGVLFKTKNFAIGCRVEHPQELINIAQWGKKSIAGVKAAEYRLTSRGDGHLPVYTFCMCPGGIIVPSTAYENANIVNGMSRYQRNEKFANAACVAAVNPDSLISESGSAGEGRGAEDVLDWLESIEHDFYRYSGGYAAPFCTIQDFIDKKLRENRVQRSNAGCDLNSCRSGNSTESSYPLGLKSAPLWELLPAEISSSIGEGLKNFSRKIRGFETGLIMGLESKTSSPVSVVREKSCCCIGFDNLYMSGEGSGHSGGIISSASDGIRAALSIINKY
ncbi:MAG: FAD-dependent monooxygenase [Desulfamplus sp.]|nr:FAD-dependent monooxygenase [Desulfamplus sp.]